MDTLIEFLGDPESGPEGRALLKPFADMVKAIGTAQGCHQNPIWITVAAGNFALKNVYSFSRRDGLHMQRMIPSILYNSSPPAERQRILLAAVRDAIRKIPSKYMKEGSRECWLSACKQACDCLQIDISEVKLDRVRFEPVQSGRSSSQKPNDILRISLALSEGFGSQEERDSMIALEDNLSGLLEQHGLGVCDGHELGEGWFVLFLYGPDADEMFRLIEPVLRASPVSKGARVTKGYRSNSQERDSEFML